MQKRLCKCMFCNLISGIGYFRGHQSSVLGSKHKDDEEEEEGEGGGEE